MNRKFNIATKILNAFFKNIENLGTGAAYALRN